MNKTNGSGSTVSRPPWKLLSTEPWRAAVELIAHKTRRAPTGRRGDGHPVVLFPGLASDGLALGPLRKHCADLGYDAMDWGWGWNIGPQGDLDAWLLELAHHVRQRVGRGRVPSLVGWSLGGLYARELAKLPQLKVRQVISIGTPFSAGPNDTNAGWAYKLLNGTPPPQDPAVLARLRQPPPVPTTSIYSRNDGIVAWQACRHARQSESVQDIEIKGSHLGMGWNPKVLDLVADRLAQPAGEWERYVEPAETAAAPQQAPFLPRW
jgi:predicted alpha/beta hydrolase family esterase